MEEFFRGDGVVTGLAKKKSTSVFRERKKS